MQVSKLESDIKEKNKEIAEAYRRIHFLEDALEKFMAENRALKADIQRRIKTDNDVLVLRVANLQEIRQQISQLYKGYFDDENIDRAAESCFDWIRDNTTLHKSYLADTIRDWWQEQGDNEFFGRADAE